MLSLPLSSKSINIKSCLSSVEYNCDSHTVIVNRST